MDDAAPEEHAVLLGTPAHRRDAQHRPHHHALLQAALGVGAQNPLESSQRISVGAQVDGRHVGATPAQRGHPGQGAPARICEQFAQRELQGAVSSVQDQQVDFVPHQLAQGLGEHPGAVGLDVGDVRVALQHGKNTGDHLVASPRAQVVEHTDSQAGLLWLQGRLEIETSGGSGIWQIEVSGVGDGGSALEVQRGDTRGLPGKGFSTLPGLDLHPQGRIGPQASGLGPERVQHPNRHR